MMYLKVEIHFPLPLLPLRDSLTTNDFITRNHAEMQKNNLDSPRCSRERGAKGIKGQFRGVVATYVCIILCLPADYESKVRQCRDTVCDCHVRGYWAGGTFSPRDYAKLLFTGTVSYTSIYHGLAVGRSLTPCHPVMRDSRRDEKRIDAKLSKFDNLGCNRRTSLSSFVE